jgi:hypothetical protein
VLKPIQQLLELLAKIPGMGGIAGLGVEKIKAFRGQNDLLSTEEKWFNKSDAEKAASVRAGMAKQPKAGTGIVAPTQPGAKPTDNGKPKPTGLAAKNEAIATGGTKNTTVNITIGKQVETLKIEAANITEGAKKMRDIIVDELTRAVAMGAALGGNS